MVRLASLDDLLVHELQDLYHAEAQNLKILPRLVNAASHPELRSALEEHRQQTEVHRRRLEQCFMLLGVAAKARKCEGMGGVVEEAEQTMEAKADRSVMDVALIGIAQKVEHYEIAAYGSACTYAELLGYDQVHELLGRTLDEEETADQKLTALAERLIGEGAEQLAGADGGSSHERAQLGTGDGRPDRPPPGLCRRRARLPCRGRGDRRSDPAPAL
jgi:ferritin-like metal-binding protein YciE